MLSRCPPITAIAGSAFFCDQRDSYAPRAAADAWERVRRLFAERLAT